MALLWRSLLQFALPQVKKSTNVLCLMKHSLDTLELVYENVRDILEKDPLYLKVIDHLQTTQFKLALVDTVKIGIDLLTSGILYCLPYFRE